MFQPTTSTALPLTESPGVTAIFNNIDGPFLKLIYQHEYKINLESLSLQNSTRLQEGRAFKHKQYIRLCFQLINLLKSSSSNLNPYGSHHLITALMRIYS